MTVWTLSCPEWMFMIGVICLGFWFAVWLYEILFELHEEQHPDDTWLDDDPDGDDTCHGRQHDTLNDDSGTDI